MPTPSAPVGRRIAKSLDRLYPSAINLPEKRRIALTGHGGEMMSNSVDIDLDCRETGRQAMSVAFTFIGDDEGDELSGSGAKRPGGPGKGAGTIYFHRGDDRGFVARRTERV